MNSRKFNEKLLNLFYNSMHEELLKDTTIKKHMNHLSFFVYYLEEEHKASVLNGIDHVQGFF